MNMERTVDSKNNIKNAEYKHLMILFVTLFAFWVILSGKFEVKFLVMGLLTCAVVTIVTRPLLRLPSAKGTDRSFLAFDIPYGRYLVYWVWLLGQIIKANIEVALLVLNPKMPIDPQVVTFKSAMEDPTAHATLANSITLTPGTITMDLEEDIYVIHALSISAAESLVSSEGQLGELPLRVAKVFNQEAGGGIGLQRGGNA